MAVTAALSRKGTRLRGFGAGEKLKAGIGRHRNQCRAFVDKRSFQFVNRPSSVRSVNRHYILVAADHVQARACGRLDGPRIVAKPIDFSFQRLINAAKCFHIGSHD